MSTTAASEVELVSLLNAGAQAAADLLSEMLSSRILLDIPRVTSLSGDRFRQEGRFENSSQVMVVSMPFERDLQGTAGFLMKSRDAAQLFQRLGGGLRGADPERDALIREAFIEVSNTLINSVLGEICNALGGRVMFGLPTFQQGPAASLLEAGQLEGEERILLGQARFLVRHAFVDGEFFILLEKSSTERLLASLGGSATQL